MSNQYLVDQYGSPPPTDSTSPIHGQDSALDQRRTSELRATAQRQHSQIELLTRELHRTQTRVRDLENQLQQLVHSLRRDQG